MSVEQQEPCVSLFTIHLCVSSNSLKGHHTAFIVAVSAHVLDEHAPSHSTLCWVQGTGQASVSHVVQYSGLLGGGLHLRLGPHLQSRAGPVRHLDRHPQWGHHHWSAFFPHLPCCDLLLVCLDRVEAVLQCLMLHQSLLCSQPYGPIESCFVCCEYPWSSAAVTPGVSVGPPHGLYL